MFRSLTAAYKNAIRTLIEYGETDPAKFLTTLNRTIYNNTKRIDIEYLGKRQALADWLQWQGSTRSAREHYEAIWQDAGEAGLEPLRRRWFGAPVALPASGAFELPDREAGPAMPVTLRVNEYGRVRVEEIDVAQARRRDARRLRMHLPRASVPCSRTGHRSTAGSCSRTGCCSRTEPRAPARCAPPRQRLLMISSAPDAAREPVVRQFLTSPPCFAMQRSAIS